MTKTNSNTKANTNKAEELIMGFLHKKSPIDGVEVVATTSEQIDSVKAEIKQLNVKSIRMMYSVLKGYGFAVSFSKSLFSPDIDGDNFKLMLKPFRSLQAVLAVYGVCKRKAEATGAEEDVKAMKKAKSVCFEELKELKKWLGVDKHCHADDIDTMEAHCFKYARKNRENIAEGWMVKSVSVYQFINFIFKELNFGDSKTECAIGIAEKSLKQGLIEASQMTIEEEQSAQKSKKSAEEVKAEEVKAE